MVKFRGRLIGSLGVCLALGATSGNAETIRESLTAAYQHSEEINAARAAVRAEDEDVPLAKSARRPFIGATGTFRETIGRNAGIRQGTRDVTLGFNASADIFRGFRTLNETRAAKADILAERRRLDETAQDVLFRTVEAYMDIVRDQQLRSVARRNVNFLGEQLRAAQDRFSVGENTRTDVAQTQASVAQGRADLAVTEANVRASIATYRQLTGLTPNNLRGSFPIERYLPRSLAAAIDVAMDQSPTIYAARHDVDEAAFIVKTIEGELLPTVSLEANASASEDFENDISSSVASFGASVTVPIYQGGAVSARVRQAKERLGQARLIYELSRETVRAQVVAFYSQLQSAQEAIVAARQGVEAAQVALSGIIEEQRVGQRTTLDVLNTQQNLLDAQANRIVAERNRIVFGFGLLQAVGRLTPKVLGLNVREYDPAHHYVEVKDKWYGLRTPDGR